MFFIVTAIQHAVNSTRKLQHRNMHHRVSFGGGYCLTSLSLYAKTGLAIAMKNMYRYTPKTVLAKQTLETLTYLD